MTDQELDAEITRLRAIKEIREQERKKKVLAEVQKRLDTIRENKDTFLLLVEHDRTSCSDENPGNGWGSHSSGGYRCAKCALIGLLNGDGPDGKVVEVCLSLRVRDP